VFFSSFPFFKEIPDALYASLCPEKSKDGLWKSHEKFINVSYFPERIRDLDEIMQLSFSILLSKRFTGNP